MIRSLLACFMCLGFIRADEPPTIVELEKQIAELEAKLRELKGVGLKPVTIAEADTWRSIRQATLSNDGNWFACRIGPRQGDGEVILRDVKTGKETKFPGGGSGGGLGAGFGGGGGVVQFSFDSKWLAFTVTPFTKPGSPPPANPPKPKVVLVKLGTNEKTEFEGMSGFQFNGELATHIGLRKAAERSESPTTTGGTPVAGPPSPPARNTDLLLRELATGNEILLGNVAEASTDKSGRWMIMLIDAAGQIGNGIHLRDMTNGTVTVLESDKATYRNISWHDEEPAFALLKSIENKDYEAKWNTLLAFSKVHEKPAKSAYNPADDKDFPEDMGISTNRTPSWTHDLSAVSFGISEQKKKGAGSKDAKKEEAPSPQRPDGPPRGPRRSGIPGAAPAPAAAADPSKPDLVIWHWKDERLQPMQQVQANMDKMATFLCIYRVEDNKFVRLADEDCKTVSIPRSGKFAIGTDRKPYEYMGNLDGQRFSDVYAIDLNSGERRKLLTKARSVFGVSPMGTHLLFHTKGNFHAIGMADGEVVNLTSPITRTKFVDLEDDHNIQDPPTRVLGWSRDGNHVLLSDNWDLWKVNVDGSGGENLTQNGKADGIRYTSFSQFPADSNRPGFDFSEPAIVGMYGEWTKKQGYGRVQPGQQGVDVLVFDDARIAGLMKARNADVYAFARETVRESPDYHTTFGEFKDATKITTANPQQKEYAWCAGSKLVDYVGVDGKKLQGALYLPAGYEEGKKYPTIVYIYEKLSNNLHGYPVPSNMGFNIARYTSNGYAVFTPDITYRLNDPGVSAYECIMPALDAAIATGIVDGDKLGLQGHSWGGYQTAFLVTQTDRFKAAVAGAPLTDLISMYSSVYWNSGSANQPIFESSQGRFTGGYWEQEAAYVRNSPVFHATKVKTPLVILHNDKDGAVDFTQGVEYYNTLRRLQKPVVMLQYKGENHGLEKEANRKDYAVRMQEFFDHYLMDKPAPDWWADGVPHLKLDEHLKQRK